MNNRWLTRIVVGACGAAASVALGTAVYGIIVGYPGLVRQVSAQETEIEQLEDNQEVLEKNQRVIDESVRDLKADSEWSQKKLDALLEKAGVTKRIPRPAMKKSDLEEVR